MYAEYEFLSVPGAPIADYPFEEAAFAVRTEKTELEDLDGEGGFMESNDQSDSADEKQTLRDREVGPRDGDSNTQGESPSNATEVLGAKVGESAGLNPQGFATRMREKATERAEGATVPAIVEMPSDDVCPFSEVHIEQIKRWAPERYGEPRLFQLMVCMGKRIAYGMNAPLTLETLLETSESKEGDLRTKALANLKLGLGLGLLNRSGTEQLLWSLTQEGRRYLMQGVRVRLAMHKVSALTAEQICISISEDEIEDWQIEARDRAKNYQQCFGLSRGARGNNEASDSSDRSAAADLSGIVVKIGNRITRAALGQVLSAKAVQEAKANAQQGGQLWAGLVR